MSAYAVGALVLMDEVRNQDAARVGLPVRNYPSTPGYHAPASPTPGSPGWSTHIYGLQAHPTNPAIFAYHVPDEPIARGLLVAMLTPAASALVNSAAPLNPAEWEYPELGFASVGIDRKKP